MQPLSHYTREMKAIAHEASQNKGIIGGGAFAWLMMIVGVIVTGTMTYSLTRKGMESSALWKQWVDVAAFLPVALLEGSAIALTYGRHFWFRSTEQRRLANIAGWIIWGLLAITSIVHFAFGGSEAGTMNTAMSIYASYVLPLAIVGAPMLWKRLYDTAPESAMRVAVLESEADLRSQLVAVQREQNVLMTEAYRESLNTPRVAAARNALFEQASIEHAKVVVGFIEGTETPQASDRPARLSTPQATHSTRAIWQGGRRIDPNAPGNGEDHSH